MKNIVVLDCYISALSSAPPSKDCAIPDGVIAGWKDGYLCRQHTFSKPLIDQRSTVGDDTNPCRVSHVVCLPVLVHYLKDWKGMPHGRSAKLWRFRMTKANSQIHVRTSPAQHDSTMKQGLFKIAKVCLPSYVYYSIT